ncbi:MAG: regulator [Phycisphaerae bacterium]|nr:regulator [Phycisphaerae bacterium]
MADQQANDTELSSKRVFTTGEAAQLCNVSQQTIIRCFDSGKLQGFRVPGSKFRRIPREELIRFMKQNGIPLDVIEGDTRRVLIVDDDQRIIDLISDILNRDGRFEIKAATNGYDAGLLTASFKPHLILVDYMLPDINGDIVIERVREMPEGKDTRILIISGVIKRDEIAHMISNGADAFMQKPFHPVDLVEQVIRLTGVAARSKDHTNGNGG